MLSCQLSKGAHSYGVLGKELEMMNWVFEIENKIVNTNTDNGSKCVKAFHVYRETAQTVEENSDREIKLFQW